MDNTPIEDTILASANGTKNVSIRQYTPPLCIESIKAYADAACTQPVMILNSNLTYYVKVFGSYGNLNISQLTFNLTTPDTHATITAVGNGVFKVDVANPPVGSSVTLIANMSYGMSFVIGTVIFTANGTSTNNIFEAVCTNDENEVFNGVAVDKAGNIICCGAIVVNGTTRALVVKFDNNMNVLVRRVSNAAYNDSFQSVTLDRWDRIICVGYTQADGVQAGLVTILTAKLTIDGSQSFRNPSGFETTFYDATTDFWGNITCVGCTSDVLGEYKALAVKFDLHLDVKFSKVCNLISESCFFGVAFDNYGLIVCVGSADADGLVVKFDNQLTLHAHVFYGSGEEEQFNGVVVDSDNNIICVGYTYTDGNKSNALIVKFDKELKILIQKTYGGAEDVAFMSVDVDIRNNIVCAGDIGTKALLVKLDTNLGVKSRKIYGGLNITSLSSVATCGNNNIVFAGLSSSRDKNNDGVILRFLPVIPSGVFVGTAINYMTLTDADLIAADSTIVAAKPELEVTDSGLNLHDITLVLAEASTTIDSDILS